MKRRIPFHLLFILSLLSGTARGHELLRTVSQENAVVVTFHYADDTPFSHQGYEIVRAGEEDPFQTGRTDRLGRVVFVPDRQATWRIRAISPDGHGSEFTLEAGEAGVAPEAAKPLFDRYPRLFAGLALIFGLFGLASLFVKKRQASER